MSLPPLVDLTIPLPGSTTTRRVLGAHLKQTLQDLLALPMGRFPARLYDDFADVRRELQRLLREGRAPLVFFITRQVTVSTLVRCLTRELYGGGDVARLDAWLSELTATLALELAAAGELPPGGLRLQQPPPAFASPGVGLAVELTPDLGLGFVEGRLVLLESGREHRIALDDLAPADLPAGVRWSRPWLPIRNGVCLALVDRNPLWAEEAHPEKFGNALDLGGHTEAEWLAALRGAVDRIDAHLPELGEELRLTIQSVVPVGYHAERHLSASYAEAVGLLYLTLHPDPMTMTEALLHEFSHNKLNAAFNLAPLLENAFYPLYPSPVRPDPRPLHGVLLAVHAFVPVARLYEVMLQAGDTPGGAARCEARLRAVVRGNHEGTVTLLQHARPTPAGAPLLEELRRWDDHFAAWR